MYFTICTPLHPYEVMMQGIPSFLPRGHGTYIYSHLDSNSKIASAVTIGNSLALSDEE